MSTYTATWVISANKIRGDDTDGDYWELAVTSWEPFSMTSVTGNLRVDGGTWNADKPNYPLGYKAVGTQTANNGYSAFSTQAFLFLHKDDNKKLIPLGSSDINTITISATKQ